MRELMTSMIAMLSLLSVAVDAPAAGGPRYRAADRPAPAEADRPAADSILRSSRGASCADIGNTELFRSKGLEYVHSAEFAEALLAVAGGRSAFSPSPVPPEWSATAVNWRMHLAAHQEAGPAPGPRPVDPAAPQAAPAAMREDGRPSPFSLASGWERFPDSGEDCNPRLVHLASREYASRPGRGDAKPVLPYHVQMAVYDLSDAMRPFASAAREIETKIASAEKLGAADCSPADLSGARAELVRACREAAECHFDPARSHAAFERASEVADELLRNRQLAARHGFVCYSR